MEIEITSVGDVCMVDFVVWETNKMQMVAIHGSPLYFLLTIKQKCSLLFMVVSDK